VSFVFIISYTILYIYFSVCHIGFCRTRQFNSDFPKELGRIIHPDEFQQLIAKINRALWWTLSQKISILVTILCVSVGFILIITGSSLVSLEITSCPFFVNVLSICTGHRPRFRLKNAVDEESIKYSTIY